MNLKKWQQCILFCFVGTTIFYKSSSGAALHDPTKPVMIALPPKISLTQASPSKEVNYTLQSIIIGPMRRLAMINGQLLGIGSGIQGARVLAIGKNHVVLFSDGKKKIIYLFDKRLWKTH
jgi:MSHA biogenesis protein MshK